MSRTPTLAILGIGTMAQAVLAGSLQGGLDPDTVVATARTPQRLDAVRERFGVRTTTDNREAVRDAELVVVAVDAASTLDVVDQVASALMPDALVVSFAGGVPLADLEEHLPNHAVARVMPNIAAEGGSGVAALTLSERCTDAQAEAVRLLMARSSYVVEVPDAQQDLVGALAGSGPAYAYYLIEAMVDGAVELGLPRRLATRLAARTLMGSVYLQQATGEHPAVLRERVCSPGGSTIRAMGELDDKGVRGAISSALSGRGR